MPSVQIVTDSCANFASLHFLQQHPVTVVPNKISLAGRSYREGVDLSADDALRLMAHQPYAPLVTSPSEAEFVEVYNRVARTCDAIISIHPSREIFPSWENALRASRQVVGSCPVFVIDSQNICVGQGMLVKVAAKAIERESHVDDMVRAVRGAIERIYSIYYVESVSYLLQNKIITPSHAVLGMMLGIKPFLGVEHGRLQLIEKVKTRLQAVDRLVEFVVEFAEVEDAVMVQHKPYISEQTRMVQDRLAVEFSSHHFPYTLYNPSLAALIGVDATGIVILEREIEEIDLDFD
ncbi:MAG TPA: DegV family protein [Phototrophicaceae bacterium]|nr:DegV family protein [Phototrophicaceae bacterium]